MSKQLKTVAILAALSGKTRDLKLQLLGMAQIFVRNQEIPARISG